MMDAGTHDFIPIHDTQTSAAARWAACDRTCGATVAQARAMAIITAAHAVAEVFANGDANAHAQLARIQHAARGTFGRQLLPIIGGTARAAALAAGRRALAAHLVAVANLVGWNATPIDFVGTFRTFVCEAHSDMRRVIAQTAGRSPAGGPPDAGDSMYVYDFPVLPADRLIADIQCQCECAVGSLCAALGKPVPGGGQTSAPDEFQPTARPPDGIRSTALVDVLRLRGLLGGVATLLAPPGDGGAAAFSNSDSDGHAECSDPADSDASIALSQFTSSDSDVLDAPDEPDLPDLPDDGPGHINFEKLTLSSAND